MHVILAQVRHVTSEFMGVGVDLSKHVVFWGAILTFVGEPGLEEGFYLARAGHEGSIAAGAFALGDVDRKVGISLEGSGGRGAVVHGCSTATAFSCVCCGAGK
jgi:hypothetical protein